MAPRVPRSGVLAATLASLAVTAPAASAAVPVTPAGWRVTPVGSEIAVDRAQPGLQGPLGAALSPDGGRLLTTSSGAAKLDSVDLFDLGARTRTSIVPYDATKAPGQALFYGVAFSSDGKKAWASGGGQQVVHAYDVDGTTVTPRTDIPTATPCAVQTGDGACFPAGIAYGSTAKGDRLYVADNLSGPASGTAGNPPGSKVTVIDPATDAVTGTIDLGDHLQPLGVAFDRKGDKGDPREPHLRPGLRRPAQGQRRPVADALRRRLGPQRSRARAALRAVRQLLRGRGGLRRRAQLDHPGGVDRLRRQDVADQLLALATLGPAFLRLRGRRAVAALRHRAAAGRPEHPALGGRDDRRVLVGQRLRTT